MNNKLDGKQTQLPPGSNIYKDEQKFCSWLEVNDFNSISAPSPLQKEEFNLNDKHYWPLQTWSWEVIANRGYGFYWNLH